MIIKLNSGAKLEIRHLNVAKVGELQSQGVKGEAVIVYREPMTTKGLKFSGFPKG